MLVAGGSTNVTTYFALRLTADGTAATGLTITNIDLQYVRSGVVPVAKVDAVALAATNTSHTDNRAIEIDATDQPGLYRVDWPDAAFAAGVREVILSVKVATAFTEHLRVEIDGEVNVVEWAGTDVVAGAIPAAAADAAGGLIVSDAGGLDVDAMNTNINDIETDTNELQGDWTNGGRLDLIVDAILVDTGTTLSGLITTVDTVVDGIQTDLSNGTDGLGALKALIDTVDTNVDSILVDTNELQGDWANGGRLDLLIDAILLDTGTTLDAAIAVIDANVDQIETAVITNAAGTDIAADIIAMKADTAAILVDTGTTLDTKLDTIDGNVDTILVDTNELQGDWANGGRLDLLIDAILVDTGTTLDGKIDTIDSNVDAILVDTNSLNDSKIPDTISLANINTQVDTALSDIQLDHLLHVADASTTTNNSIVAKMVSKSGTAAFSSFTNTTDSLEALRDNQSGATAAAIADAVLDEALSGHTTSGTLGKAVADIETDATAILVDTGTTLDGKIDTIDSNVDAILVDTGTTLDGKIDTIDGIVDSILVDTGTTLDAAIAVIDTNVDQIEAAVITNAAGADIAADIIALKAETVLIVADTGELQTDWVNGGRLDLIVDAILVDTGTTLDGKIDTIDSIVDAILVDTGTTLDAAIAVIDANVDQIETAVITNAAGTDIAADIIALKAETVLIVADTSELQGDWANAGRLDVILDAILVDTATTIPGTITTIDSNVDAILVDTDTTIPALIATAQADLDTITGTGGVLFATAQTAAAWSSLEASAGQILERTVDTATNSHTPTTTEFQADDETEATADHFNGRIVVFTSGALAGQSTDITDYESVGGIGQYTVTAMTSAPSNNDTFIVL